MTHSRCSASRNQRQSSLLRLPLELRDRIHDLTIETAILDLCTVVETDGPKIKLIPRSLALLTVCRQLYHDWHSIPRIATILIVWVEFESLFKFVEAIKRFEQQLQQVQTLHVDGQLASKMVDHWNNPFK